jgi:hypothetical protein
MSEAKTKALKKKMKMEECKHCGSKKHASKEHKGKKESPEERAEHEGVRDEEKEMDEDGEGE